MSPAPKKVDVSTVPSIKDLEVKSIELKPPEDEQEKTLRLHKERLSFYFKELGTLVFAAILVIVVVICCLVFCSTLNLLRPKRTGLDQSSWRY